MRAQILLTAAAIVLSAPLATGASARMAGYPGPRAYDGLLAEPPAGARAGECFAKVAVPGQPIYGPPAAPHLRWVQSPPPPGGAATPVWCQVWEQGVQPTITYTPERYGWIRVICDRDATRVRISHIQHRLHDWGYYQGGYDGAYDAVTAEAVRRFQHGRHIEHGGYLSFETLEALELPPPTTYAQTYAPPVYQKPIYAPQTCQDACQQPVPPPCGPAPCQGGYGYAPQDYGPTPPYAQRWLTWPGKASY